MLVTCERLSKKKIKRKVTKTKYDKKMSQSLQFNAKNHSTFVRDETTVGNGIVILCSTRQERHVMSRIGESGLIYRNSQIASNFCAAIVLGASFFVSYSHCHAIDCDTAFTHCTLQFH